MKLHSPEFERRLRARVRPAWRAAGKRRRPGPPSKVRRLSSAMVLSYLLAIAAIRFSDLRHHGWTTGAQAALFGLFLTWIAAVLEDTRASKWSGPDFALLYRLPASEDTIFAWGWRRLWKVRWGFFITIATGLVVLWLGQTIFMVSDFWKIAPIAGLGAAALTITTTLPFSAVVRSKAAIFFWGLAVGLIAVFPESPPQRALRESLIGFGSKLDWLHPGGWIAALWVGSTSDPESATVVVVSIFLLVALSGLAGWSRHRLRSTFDSQRHARLPHEVLTADSQRGFEILEPPEEVRRRVAESWRNRSEIGFSTPTDEQQSEHPARALPGHALDRWVESRFSPRERLLIALFPGEGRNYAKNSFAACRGLIVVFLIATAVNVANFPTVGYKVMWAGGLIAFSYVISEALPEVPRIAGFLPISYREIAGLEWKLFSYRFVLLLAPIALFSAGFTYFTRVSAGACAIFGLKAAILAALSSPLFTVMSFSKQETDRYTWRR